MTDNSNGAPVEIPGKGTNLDTSAVTKDPRGDAGPDTAIVASADHARQQLTLPIFAAPDPLPCGTYAGADLALTADAWAATGYTAAVEYFAASGQEFTCDAVRGVVGDPASNQLLGAVFSHAARRGIIRAVHVQPSARRERRGGLRRVWVGTDEFVGSFRTADREAVG